MSLFRIRSLFNALPSVTNSSFLKRVKEIIDIGTGNRGDLTKRWVSLGDLVDANIVKYLNDQEYSVTKPDAVKSGGRIPEPPTSLTVIKTNDPNRLSVFAHHLTWTVPTDDTISYFEIWSAASNDRSAATRIGIVTYPQNEYVRFNPDPTLDYYYWVRSVGWNGKYSTWEPSDVQGGYVVPGDEALGDAIDRLVDTLKGQDPSSWSSSTTYSTGDQVKYVCTDGATRSYESLTDSNLNNIPEGDTTNWKRIGFLTTGDVDGISTVAIDGNLVVDNTILARHIIAGSITGTHIAADTIVGTNIQAGAVDTDQLAAHAATADKIYVASLDGISATLGEVIAGTMTGLTIRTASSGKRVVMSSEGLRLETGATAKTYGDSTYKYGDSTRKYGSGVLAYILHMAKSIPFYIQEEQTVADFHYYDRSSNPSGAAERGDTCVVNGVLKICTTAGHPGTWTVVGGQA